MFLKVGGHSFQFHVNRLGVVKLDLGIAVIKHPDYMFLKLSGSGIDFLAVNLGCGGKQEEAHYYGDEQGSEPVPSV